MSTTVVVRFVLGRYHATPWGHHVNEGQVELPPSPWRLLRALYAVWKTRVVDLDETLVHDTLSGLAAPPTYFVPPHRIAHTRHYYPDSGPRSGSQRTDRTLDAFALLDRDAELGIRWPETLPPEHHKALSRLVESLPYLGRADSVCEAWVDPLWQPGPHHFAVSPLDVSESIPGDVDAMTLLCPTLPLDVAALVARTVDVRADRLLFPPSARFVGYLRPPQTRPTRRPARARTGDRVQAVRFSVVSRVRPPITDAVVLTDRLRLAAVSRLGRSRGDTRQDSLLAGRHADGSLMREHRHAHYLALPDPERRIGELAVWTPAGLDAEELEAVMRIGCLWPPRPDMPGPGEIEVRVSSVGRTDRTLDDLAGKATMWESVTPFVPPRHPRKDWTWFLQSEIDRELAHRGLPATTSVRVLDGDWRTFLRQRPSKRFAAAAAGFSSQPGAMLRVTFPAPIHGPLALGHLSHFGLGVFAPAD